MFAAKTPIVPATRYGPDALTERLGQQAACGIQYHWPKQLVGDYDVLDREDEICAMVWENQLPNRQEGV